MEKSRWRIQVEKSRQRIQVENPGGESRQRIQVENPGGESRWRRPRKCEFSPAGVGTLKKKKLGRR